MASVKTSADIMDGVGEATGGAGVADGAEGADGAVAGADEEGLNSGVVTVGVLDLVVTECRLGKVDWPHHHL